MTSNAFCSIYLLLLFCCKIQNVITYKFHYFLKELNYLISVWSKKMCLLMAEIANKINHNPVWGPNLKYWMNHFFKVLSNDQSLIFFHQTILLPAVRIWTFTLAGGALSGMHSKTPESVALASCISKWIVVWAAFSVMTCENKWNVVWSGEKIKHTLLKECNVQSH